MLGLERALILARRRRLWHSTGNNTSDLARKVIFLGYAYRWFRPRDDMTISHCLPSCGPVMRQLLGVGTDGGAARGVGYRFSSPRDADVPLKRWIAANLGEQAVLPPNEMVGKSMDDVLVEAVEKAAGPKL